MTKVVGIRFERGCRIYDFDPADYQVKKGNRVVVETEMGISLAWAATEVRELPEDSVNKELKKILRLATEDDLMIEKSIKDREKSATDFCLSKISEKCLQMKLVGVKFMFDGQRATFYFTADGRVDFRELVRELAHQLHIRVEMKQIGVRDASKVAGGVGPCGNELCCTCFLNEFGPVSVKMAKEQGLPLNPAKISGLCGRLMCCLAYEYTPKNKGKACPAAESCTSAASDKQENTEMQ